MSFNVTLRAPDKGHCDTCVVQVNTEGKQIEQNPKYMWLLPFDKVQHSEKNI